MAAENTLTQFTGLYPVSKTLRFELKPIGKTLEKIKETGIIENDEKRHKDYFDAKKIIDTYHKYFIDAALSKFPRIDWNPLKEAIEGFLDRSDASKKKLEKTQTEFRKKIAKALTTHDHYKELTASTPKDLFLKVFPDHFGKQPAIDTFDGFSSYFTGFQENRQNIYSDEAISTAIPYRLVHDNFPKFLSNIEVYKNLSDYAPDVLSQAENELKDFLNGKSLANIFELNAYNEVLTQSGIDFFNQVIGGISGEGGEKKTRGINEFSNLYRQQHPEFAQKRLATKMIPLYKQILSDRETKSFILESYSNDSQVQDSVKEFFESQILSCDIAGRKVNVLNELSSLIKRITEFDLGSIYVNQEELSNISLELFKNWNTINAILFKNAEKRIGSAEKAANKKKIDAWMKSNEFSIATLNLAIAESDSEEISKVKIESYWNDFEAKVQSILCGDKRKNLDEFLSATFNENNALREDSEVIGKLKAFLDALIEIMHSIKPLISDAENRDLSFYNELTPLYDQLSLVVPLYNKIRNYATQKLTESEKFKLNFDNPTLADGWDQNKEDANTAILLLKNGLYYLGIMNAKNKPKITDFKTSEDEDCYDKMVYKLLPGPNKMLPKVFFSEKGLATFKPPKDILDGYNAGKHKKGDLFDIDFCHQLIDFFKESIAKHPDWKKFDFKFSDTSSYEDISGFYKEVTDQGYKITFSKIPTSQIDEWVNDGKLFLFQIYNKDFAPGAKGSPNLHTLYWKSVFSPENLKDVVVKLNGEAELFYRPSCVKKTYSHKVGEKLVNRIGKDGLPLPESVFGELFRYFNGKLDGELSDEAKKYLDIAVVKDVKHEIVKDRRYTQDKFEFHVPLTLNFKADSKNEYMNERVRHFLKDNPDINIIGIDRGERHLLYMTLINQKGEILKQKSFNIVESVNYQAKLVQREKERDAARRSWSSVGKIKDLKEGFLSQVIHEITTTMIDNNAIVVLEDLNFGFKRGRFCVERQVYQKFEKMLIDKLNYLVFKNKPEGDVGGVLKGYQLAEKFDSFQKLGKQSGFLFYIPAAYTSKIDPTTGFANLFNMTELTSAEKKKEFLSHFEDITYDGKNDRFSFSFDYKDFKCFQTDYIKKWTVYTQGKRIVYDKESKSAKEIFPVEIIKAALEKQNIALTDQLDVLSVINSVEASPKSASFFGDICYAFEKTLQMRNSIPNTDEDYLVSPVMNKKGEFYDSRSCGDTLPKNADANGAYHIALKGLYLIKNVFDAGGKDLKISHEDWFKFAQSRNA
ncbi:type V CRISPR-associated protein Cas12a/Cpf1 [uncultured Fibrobacter sp.]|uniref:type V CRISPR-associated protein Cas12a/Cpf1 n=1 Tax=uncultured Fibrobacter sp. TaxID=261512 RepID=UPI00261671DD|nr:type V CRISPR-associated protein Cas12a/Cpf1 [uncultured Fibrobacter sp.]